MAHNLRDQILGTCFQRQAVIFASGQAANNKLDLEKLQDYPELRRRTAAAVGRLVVRCKPDLIIPMPNGANWLGQDVAMSRGIDHITLFKDKDTKEFSYREDGQQIVDGCKRIVVVDDVLNQFTNTEKALSLPGIAEKCVCVAGIWRRGDPDIAPSVDVPVEAVIDEYIPAQLPDDSELWPYVR